MSDENEKRPGWRELFFHPVNLTVGFIVGSMIFLVLFAILGWDEGDVLVRLSNTEFARGLITYFFAVGTIGLAVVLVLGTLLGGEDTKERFARGKEILALLLGIFGTIVGFYYGSTLPGEGATPGGLKFELSRPKFSPAQAAPGGTVTINARVRGGEEPVKYRIVLDPPLIPTRVFYVESGGKIEEKWPIPDTTRAQTFGARVIVTDAGGDSMSRGAVFTVKATR